jgi:cell division septal protein FtsQ
MAGARGSARRDLVARLFRTRNRRSAVRARAWWPPARAVVGAVVAVIVAIGCWTAVRDAIRHHPYFALREVAVRGARRLSAEAVRAASGLRPGMSVWDVDSAGAETRLRTHGWIRTARVRRELPSRVVIDVREERAAAIFAPDGNEERPYYVSRRGRLIAPVTPGDARDLPYVTGLRLVDVRAGDGFGSRALHRALGLARRRGLEVSEVHVDRVRGLTLMPTRPPVPIELGWRGFEQKLGRLPRVLALWAGREREVTAVSCLFDDEVIVHTRAATDAGPVRRARRS